MRAAGHYKNGADIGSSKFGFLDSILVPYLFLIGSQIPLAVVYFRGLWQTRDHYRLFPFVLLAVGFFVYSRWPRDDENPFFRSRLSAVLLCGGVAAGLLATLLVTPWLAYVSLVAFAASLLSRTRGNQIGRSLVGILVPLVVLIQPPAEFDFDDVQGDLALAAAIKTSGVAFAGSVLDILSTNALQVVQVREFVHNRDATVIEFPDLFIDAEPLGAGWRSTFSLLMVASILIAAARRTFVHGTLLLAATVLCGVFVLAVQLFAISVGHVWLQQDWQVGFSAQALETTLFLFGILMIYCTDQLLCFFFGPVDTSSIDESAGFQSTIARWWNTILSGTPEVESDFEDHRVERRHSRPTRLMRHVLWVLVPVMGLAFLVQLIDLSRAAAIARRLPAEKAQAQRITAQSLKEVGWVSPPQFHERENNKTDAMDSAAAVWDFESPASPSTGFEATVELDYPFPGWQDAVRRFARQGWDLDRQPVAHVEKMDQEGRSWDLVEATFSKPFGQHCNLFFVSFDASGRPIDRPLTWDTLGDLPSRTRQRLANRITARLLVPTVFQVRAFAITPTAKSPEEVRRLRELFLSARTELRTTMAPAR